MKFVTYRLQNGTIHSGVLEGGTVCPLALEAEDEMLAYLESGANAPSFTGDSLALSSVRLLAPLLHPPRIFGIGLNYREHAAESKMDVQGVPTVFLKLPSSLTGPDSDVLLRPNATKPDYEAELAVIIGKGGGDIPAERWQEHVFGYTILNDISARGVQLATTQWSLGKSFPTFAPLGPAIVTSDEIPNPHELDISLTLGGEMMQSANTRDLIFRIPQLIEYISSIVPLEPGDIISTGTPSGVGMGRLSQRWLQPNEEMVIHIHGVGTLRNTTRSVE